MSSDREILDTLREIRGNQEKQLEGLQESLKIQREQYEMAKAVVGSE
jgi:hypothetical protein